MGVSFHKELVVDRVQVYPPLKDQEEKDKLQARVFYFTYNASDFLAWPSPQKRFTSATILRRCYRKAICQVTTWHLWQTNLWDQKGRPWRSSVVARLIREEMKTSASSHHEAVDDIVFYFCRLDWFISWEIQLFHFALPFPRRHLIPCSSKARRAMQPIWVSATTWGFTLQSTRRTLKDQRKEPSAWESERWAKWMKTWHQSHLFKPRDCLIQLPTSSGKGLTSLKIAANFYTFDVANTQYRRRI